MNTIKPTGGMASIADPSIPTASPTSPATSSSPSDTGAELKEDAAKLKEKAAQNISAHADEASSKAASAAKSTSSALRDVGDTLEQDSDTPNWLGTAFKQAADTIADLADTVEGKKPEEMMRDVSGFARSNPTGFLAGAALAGFAAARFMKAGLDQSDASFADLDPARSENTGAPDTTSYTSQTAGSGTRSTEFGVS